MSLYAPSIEVVFGDILKADTDAIVNAANRFMLHGGGLAAVIARAAGFEMTRVSQAKVESHPIDTGEAIITPAFNLPFKAIIHTVGPVWQGDTSDTYWRSNSTDEDPDILLANAHKAALELAWGNDITSVAFPAVSCGVFRFPVERAAPIAVRAVKSALDEYSPPVERVCFYVLDEWHHRAFQEALASLDE